MVPIMFYDQGKQHDVPRLGMGRLCSHQRNDENRPGFLGHLGRSCRELEIFPRIVDASYSYIRRDPCSLLVALVQDVRLPSTMTSDICETLRSMIEINQRTYRASTLHVDEAVIYARPKSYPKPHVQYATDISYLKTYVSLHFAFSIIDSWSYSGYLRDGSAVLKGLFWQRNRWQPGLLTHNLGNK